MTIAWLDFLIVAITTAVSALVIVGAYSFGVRLLAVAEDEGRSRSIAKSAAYACFGLCGAIVIFGIMLIVPALSENILGL